VCVCVCACVHVCVRARASQRPSQYVCGNDKAVHTRTRKSSTKDIYDKTHRLPVVSPRIRTTLTPGKKAGVCAAAAVAVAAVAVAAVAAADVAAATSFVSFDASVLGGGGDAAAAKVALAVVALPTPLCSNSGRRALPSSVPSKVFARAASSSVIGPCAAHRRWLANITMSTVSAGAGPSRVGPTYVC
jgi:hypothetical protein